MPFEYAQRTTLVTFVYLLIIELALNTVHSHKLTVGSESNVVQTTVETGIVRVCFSYSVGAEFLYEFLRAIVDEIKFWSSAVIC